MQSTKRWGTLAQVALLPSPWALDTELSDLAGVTGLGPALAPASQFGRRIWVTQTSDMPKHDVSSKVWHGPGLPTPIQRGLRWGRLPWGGGLQQGLRCTRFVGRGAAFRLPPRVTEQPPAGMWEPRGRSIATRRRRDPRSSRGAGARLGS